MTPQYAREYISKYARLATGRMHIALAERALQCKLPEIFDDNDLVVIFAEHLRGS